MLELKDAPENGFNLSQPHSPITLGSAGLKNYCSTLVSWYFPSLLCYHHAGKWTFNIFMSTGAGCHKN